MRLSDAVLYAKTDGIATITLNRPDKLNAWTPAMERDVKAAVQAAGADEQVRAIVITGAGKGFCAGADISNLAAAADGDTSLLPAPASNSDPFGQRYTYFLATPKPVVAAVNGVAAGVGFALTLFCDFRFVGQQGRFTPIFARRGLIAEHGAAWMLPRLIGPAAALDLLISGRSVDAEEAASLRLAKLVAAEKFLDGVYAAVHALVDASSPRSIGVIKRQVYRGLMQDLAQGVAEATEEQIASLQSADFAEGVAHFRERRPPRFTGN